MNTNQHHDQEQIPQYVIDALLIIRDNTATNMLARNTVIALIIDRYGYAAADWLMDNPERYMDALNAMGKQVQP